MRASPPLIDGGRRLRGSLTSTAVVTVVVPAAVTSQVSSPGAVGVYVAPVASGVLSCRQR